MQERQQRLTRYFKKITEDEQALEAIGDGVGALERLEKAPPQDASDEELESARTALRKLADGRSLAPSEEDALEAIVLPQERPVIDIRNDSYGQVEAPFVHFGENPLRQKIERAIPSIGRIGVPSRPSLPFAGTGFVVGKNLLMTNRHVAGIFCQGLGRDGLSFQSGQEADVDFKQELGTGTSLRFAIRNVLLIHPFWDMALLEVEGLPVEPLRFLSEDPGDLAGRDIAVVGYPAFDGRNDAELQFRIFRKTFNVKRLQPGRLRERRELKSFGNMVSALTHDSSTLGGNSGSAVVDVDTGRIVALHFAGLYLDANFAVPAFELARDARIHEAGVDFEGTLPDQIVPWERQWQIADPSPEATGGGAGVPPGTGEVGSDRGRTLAPGEPATWSIPLEVTIRLGTPSISTDTRSLVDAEVATEKMVEPFHEDDYEGRPGYQENFLGLRVPLPELTDLTVVSKQDDGNPVLAYEHFSLALHKTRRIAIYTAANVDGRPSSRRPDPGKSYTRDALSGLGKNDREKWFTDPRIPALHQLPDRFFNKDRASFDKGHLVRRDAVAWGASFDDLRRANGDTYHVTNCSPQVAGFNRSNLGGLWGKLENLVLRESEAADEKYVVLAGPILAADDPPFSGFDDEGRTSVKIPRRFWKLVVARRGSQLQSFAFLLDQDLSDVPFEFAPNSAWRSRMSSVDELEREIGLLRFPPEIHDSDQAGSAAGERVRASLT